MFANVKKGNNQTRISIDRSGKEAPPVSRETSIGVSATASIKPELLSPQHNPPSCKHQRNESIQNHVRGGGSQSQHQRFPKRWSNSSENENLGWIPKATSIRGTPQRRGLRLRRGTRVACATVCCRLFGPSSALAATPPKGLCGLLHVEFLPESLPRRSPDEY